MSPSYQLPSPMASSLPHRRRYRRRGNHVAWAGVVRAGRDDQCRQTAQRDGSTFGAIEPTLRGGPPPTPPGRLAPRPARASRSPGRPARRRDGATAPTPGTPEPPGPGVQHPRPHRRPAAPPARPPRSPPSASVAFDQGVGQATRRASASAAASAGGAGEVRHHRRAEPPRPASPAARGPGCARKAGSVLCGSSQTGRSSAAQAARVWARADVEQAAGPGPPRRAPGRAGIAGQATRPGPPDQRQQHGLGLVLAGVAEQDGADAVLGRGRATSASYRASRAAASGPPGGRRRPQWTTSTGSRPAAAAHRATAAGPLGRARLQSVVDRHQARPEARAGARRTRPPRPAPASRPRRSRPPATGRRRPRRARSPRPRAGMPRRTAGGPSAATAGQSAAGSAAGAAPGRSTPAGRRASASSGRVERRLADPG